MTNCSFANPRLFQLSRNDW